MAVQEVVYVETWMVWKWRVAVEVEVEMWVSLEYGG